jgi:hypothetical protein
VGRVDLEIGDQRFGKALHRKFRGTISGVRNARPDRCPEAIDAAGVDDVALIGLLQHRQKGAGAVIDPAPTDVEGLFPLLGAVGDHAAAAADAGVVEQQVDFVCVVASGDLVAKPLHLRGVGNIGDVGGHAQALRHSRRFAQKLRFRQPRCRNVAHRDTASFGDQLANQFPSHPRAAAGNDRDLPREILHMPSLPYSVS